MNNLYICKYFKINELVPEELIKSKTNQTLMWYIFDQNLLVTIDMIREFVDTPIYINTKNYNGQVFNESGFRFFENVSDDKKSAVLSQHKFGRANDLKFNGNGWTPEKLRLYMQDIGCFSSGWKKNFVIPYLDLKKWNRQTNLIEYIWNKIDRSLPYNAVPFIFINRIEWKYKNNPKREMSWFHFDLGNNISDKIEIFGA